MSVVVLVLPLVAVVPSVADLRPQQGPWRSVGWAHLQGGQAVQGRQGSWLGWLIRGLSSFSGLLLVLLLTALLHLHALRLPAGSDSSEKRPS